MLMALVVIGGFGVLYVFVFDAEMQGKGVTIESVIRDNQKEIESYQEQIRYAENQLKRSESFADLSKKLDETRQEKLVLENNIKALGEELEKTKATLVTTQTAWDQYKVQYRSNVRTKAVGEKIDEIVLKSGAVYKNAEIREVSAVGVQIRHTDGQKRIPFEELSEEWQERFQFDAEQKEQALAAELAAQKMHDEAVEKAAAVEIIEQADPATLKDLNGKTASTNPVIRAREIQLAQMQTELGTMQSEFAREEADAVDARRFGRGGMNRVGPLREKIALQRKQIEALKKEIKVLKYGPN